MEDKMKTQAIAELERQLLALLDGEFSSLSIGFNEASAPNYQTVVQAIETGTINPDTDWVSEDSKQRAIATGRHWDIHWYPNSPVGFNQISGATLPEVIEAAIASKASRT